MGRLGGHCDGGEPRSYAYDNYGNLVNLAGLSLVVNTDTNRLTTVGGVSVAGEWDLRGNLTKVPSSAGGRAKRLWYSAEDRLMKSKDITSEQTWRFAYDAAGERVAAWQRDSQGQLQDVTLFLRDEAGRVLSDWQLIPGVSFGPKQDYLYAGDRLALQLDWTAEGPVRRYIAVDHLNSTRAIVDDNGNVEEIDYLPFGGFLTGDPQPDTTHLFTGHERDTAQLASNLDYMHARYFSPNLGRFLSVDPVGGEVGSSQSWNRYSYVLNNPLNLVDPTGMQEDGEEETADEGFWKRLWDKIVGKAAPERETPESDLQDSAALAEAAGLNPDTSQTRMVGLDGANAFADGTREALATMGAEMSETVAYGLAFGVAGKSVRVLQSGGRSVKAATAKSLGLEKRQAGRALERLKRFYGIPSDSHGKILSNGDYVDSRTGEVIDNILGFLE